MKALDLSEIQERDKLGAAFHEAGHAAVALALGSASVRAWIAPTGTAKFMEEKTWTGKCSYGNTNNESRAVIAVAGVVAEAIRGDEWNENWAEDFWLSADELSPTDAEGMAGFNFEEIAARAHAILTEGWRLVESIAAALMRDESLTDWQLLQLSKGRELAA